MAYWQELVLKQSKTIQRLFFAGVILLFFSGYGLSQEVQPLTLVIKASKGAYDVDETLSIAYVLKNVSQKRILLNKNIVPGGNLFFEIDKVRGPATLFQSAFWTLDENISFLEPGQVIIGSWHESSIAQFKGWKEDPHLKGTKKIRAFLTMYVKKNNRLEASQEIASNAVTIKIRAKKGSFDGINKEEAIVIGQKVMKSLTLNKGEYYLKEATEVLDGRDEKWRLLFALEDKVKKKAPATPKTFGAEISVYVDKKTGKATIVSED